MTRSFIIVEIPDEEINNTECGLMTAFKYMVENTETGGRWFGSNDRAECQAYIDNM
jgi:hypothetical protein